jgi:hypothetical protein
MRTIPTNHSSDNSLTIVLHGASRVPRDGGAAAFRALPATDPHHLDTPAETRAKRRSARQAKKHAANQEMRALLYARIASRCHAREARLS